MTFGDGIQLTLFTNDPDLAARADAAGVDRIGLDLERLGKDERQRGHPGWISDHRLDQLSSIRDRLSSARLFARTNPIHDGSRVEIEQCLALGAKVLMLPMFTTAREAGRFVDMVAGRADVSLLVETPAAGVRIHDLVALPGVGEIHVGLNDMHLAMGLASHFEVLVSGFLDAIARVVVDAGIPFGFGGVGRLHDSGLPIPADLVYAQYPRLRASRALVSRVFVGPDAGAVHLPTEVALTRQRLTYWARQSAADLDRAREALREAVRRSLPE